MPPAVYCPQPPNVAQSIQTGNSIEVLSLIDYECQIDLRHEDGYSNKTIMCDAEGRWTETQMSCGGQ